MDPTAIVIDNGTGSVKAGFAFNDVPSSIFPAVVGKPDDRSIDVLVGASRDTYIGEEAQNKRGLLALSYPMEHGIVTNWDDMERIWHYTFWDELGVNPQEYPVLLTEAPHNPMKQRVQMLQTMFESFDVPACYVSIQAVLSMYASGKTSGVVVDIGDGVTHVVPIFEGYTVPNAIRRINLAGRDLTEFLVTLIMEYGECKDCDNKDIVVDLQTSAGLEIARTMKEDMCFVHPDYDDVIKRLKSGNRDETSEIMKEYSEVYTGMPDGSHIKVGAERFICPEALFKPNLVGVEGKGIHRLIDESIKKCQFDIRETLYRNVLLSGGTTMLKGLEVRLEKELRGLAPSSMEPRVVAPDERKYSVWIGGSILASLSSFQNKWITRQDFEEMGPYALKNKCF